MSRRGDQKPEPVRLERAGGADRRPLLRLEGVGTREEAAGYSGALLLAAGGALDEIPHYVVGELIGLRAVCDGRDLGAVTDVLQGVAHDILQITAADGAEVLVPLVAELVTIDEESATVTVREGLL